MASGPVAAQPWTFDAQPIEVLGTSAGIVHQMSSAGRRSLAVSEGTVAVVGDDEHAGIPRAYLALKDPNTAAFAPAIQISGDGDAFELAVAALPCPIAAFGRTNATFVTATLSMPGTSARTDSARTDSARTSGCRTTSASCPHNGTSAPPATPAARSSSPGPTSTKVRATSS